MSVPPEEREAFWEKLYAEPGFGIWMGNFRDILIDETANAAISGFIAKKIRQRVKDPKVADKLIRKIMASAPVAYRWRAAISRRSIAIT